LPGARASVKLAWMANPFESFAATLSDEDRGILHGSVAFALRVVASADSTVDGKEEKAVEAARASAGERLGVAFAEPAASYASAIAAAGHPEWPSSDYVRKLGKILQRMPKDARATYDRCIAELAFSVAHASGGVLGFGQKMSAEEKFALRRLVSALRLELEDTDKARLGL
jgi:hypothetical protein